MAHGSARIDSPEIIKGFRIHMVKFNESCQQAIAGVKSDVYHVQQWLLSDQLNHWKSELQHAEQRVLQARHEYNEARFGSEAMRKPSYVDEQRAMRKAEARREEARNKIMKIKRAGSMLQNQAEKLMGPVNHLTQTLDTQVPQSLARLDNMIVSLEEYLKTSPPDAGG
jgi:hypothetical protein